MTTRIVLLSLLMALGSCRPWTSDDERAKREREQKSDEAARKAGHAAYEVTHDAEKAAKELGNKLEKAGEEARKGWHDAQQEHSTRPARDERSTKSER